MANDDYGSRVEQLEAELQSLKRGDNNTILGIIQGIGSAVLVLTVGELLVWYLNWFCVWIMYWLVVHILPFRLIFDLRFIVWAGIFLIVGLWFLPATAFAVLNSKELKSKKIRARNIAFFIVLIPGLLIWLLDFIRFLIHVPW